MGSQDKTNYSLELLSQEETQHDGWFSPSPSNNFLWLQFKPNKEFLLIQYMNRFELVSTFSKSLILESQIVSFDCVANMNDPSDFIHSKHIMSEEG